MINSTSSRVWILLTASLAISVCAHASLIVGDLFSGTVTSFGDGNSNCSTGPTTEIDSGFSISTNGAACFSYTAGWSFASNGTWFSLPALSDDSGSTTLTINLNGEYSSVAGFMNYAWACPDFPAPCTYIGNDPTVTALDKNMNVLETEDISGWLDVGDDSEFDFTAGDNVELTQSTSDIAYLQFGGDFIAMTDISLAGPAPEPPTSALSALALLATCLAVWRAKSQRPAFRTVKCAPAFSRKKPIS